MAAGQWLEGRVAGFTALPERTVDAVFKTVVANQAQFGVVPIENSHTGISATTRDLLVQVRPLTPLTALLDIVLRAGARLACAPRHSAALTHHLLSWAS